MGNTERDERMKEAIQQWVGNTGTSRTLRNSQKIRIEV